MVIAALIAWAATAAAGAVMIGIWLTNHRPTQHRTGRSRFGPKVLLSHVSLAVLGLTIWITALVSGTDWLRWVSVALLPIVASLGASMFLKWLGGRGARGARSQTDVPAEQRFSVVVVTLHGILAITTLLLVVLAAVGLGS